MPTLRPTQYLHQITELEATPSVKHCVSKILKNAPQRRLEHHQAPGGWERLEQRQATWFSFQYCDLEPVHGRLLMCFTVVLQRSRGIQTSGNEKEDSQGRKTFWWSRSTLLSDPATKLPGPSNDWATQLDEVWNEDGFVEHNQVGKQELQFVWARITRCWHGWHPKNMFSFTWSDSIHNYLRTKTLVLT